MTYRRFPPSYRRRKEHGTASLEASLCLPFLLLLFLLAVNVGYGAINKMRALSATRFATSIFMDEIDRPAPLTSGVSREEAARRAAESRMRAAYYPEASRDTVLFRATQDRDSFPQDWISSQAGAPPGGEGAGLIASLRRRLERLIGRVQVQVSVPLDAPLGQNVGDEDLWWVWADGRANGRLQMNTNCWTYHTIPLSFETAVEAPKNHIDGMFSFLGGFLSFLARWSFKFFGLIP